MAHLLMEKVQIWGILIRRYGRYNLDKIHIQPESKVSSLLSAKSNFDDYRYTYIIIHMLGCDIVKF